MPTTVSTGAVVWNRTSSNYWWTSQAMFAVGQYVYVVSQTSSVGNRLQMHRAPINDLSSFTAMDAGNGPSVYTSGRPFSACATSTHIHVAYYSGLNTISHALFDVSTGVWSTGYGVATTDGWGLDNIRIAVRSDGDVLIFYNSNADDADVKLTRYEGSSWTETFIASVTDGATSVINDVVMDGNDYAHVFYSHASQDDGEWASVAPDNSVSTVDIDTTIVGTDANQSSGSFEISPAGTVSVVWRNSDNTLVENVITLGAAASSGSVSSQITAEVDTAAYVQNSVFTTAWAGTHTYLVYTDDANTSTFYYRLRTGATFGARTTWKSVTGGELSSATSMAVQAANIGGNIVVLYQDGTSVLVDTLASGAATERWVPATVLISSSFDRTVPATALVAVVEIRTVPATALIGVDSTRTVPSTARIGVDGSRTVPATVRISESPTRTVPATALVSTVESRTVPATTQISTVLSRTVPATAAISTIDTRTVPASALMSTTLDRTVPATVAISTILTHTVPASAAISTTLSRTIPASVLVSTTASREVPSSVAISTSHDRAIPATTAISTSHDRTVPATAEISTESVQTRVVPSTAAIQTVEARTIPATAAISTVSTRTIPASAVVSSVLSRTIPASVAISTVTTKTIPASAAIATIGSRTVPASALLALEGTRVVPAQAAVATTNDLVIPSSAQVSASHDLVVPGTALIGIESVIVIPAEVAIVQLVDQPGPRHATWTHPGPVNAHWTRTPSIGASLTQSGPVSATWTRVASSMLASDWSTGGRPARATWTRRGD